MLNNNAVFKYEIPYKGQFDIIHQISYNIHSIKPYTYDTNIEYIIAEN